MKTILVPTDFSTNSIKALECAFDFFKDDSQFILCHVYDIPRGGTSSLFFLLEELRKQAEKDMASLMDMLEIQYNSMFSRIKSEIARGDFSEQIKNISAEYMVDFIVMGTKGSSGVHEVILGSNAAKLVGNSEVPVLTVPEMYDRANVKELVLCYDGKEINEKVAKQIHDFSGIGKLPIKLFHVRSAKESPIQNWAEIEKLVDDQHTSLYEEFGDSLEEGLKNRMDQLDSIIVLIRRNRSFWDKLFSGSHSKRIVSHISLPILILPE